MIKYLINVYFYCEIFIQEIYEINLSNQISLSGEDEDNYKVALKINNDINEDNEDNYDDIDDDNDNDYEMKSYDKNTFKSESC